MPLFADRRDSMLANHFSKEIIQHIVSIEVELYKLDLTVKTNMYGETSNKAYYNPIKVFALMNKSDKTSSDEDIGLNFTKTVQFNFLRTDLLHINYLLEEGDIIKYDAQFFEVDNVRQGQYWAGRNNETFKDYRQDKTGYNISVIAETHLTRLSTLNLVDVRQGTNNYIDNSLIGL